VNATLAFQIKGSISIGPVDGRPYTPGRIAALAGAETSCEAHFPGEHLIAGVSLMPGAAPALGLFSPGEIQGIQSLDSPFLARALARCNDLTAGSDLLGILSPIQNLFSDLIKTRPGDKKEPPPSIVDKLPSFGSKISYRGSNNGISLRQIERICLQHSGYTPRQCMALKACSTARKIIFTRKFDTFSDLALELGFYDQAHFSRIFKKWYGMSPGEYNRFFDPYRKVMIKEKEF
jgi:hypothetical protein